MEKIVTSIYKIDLSLIKTREFTEKEVVNDFDDLVEIVRRDNEYETDWGKADITDDVIVLFKKQLIPLSWGRFFSGVLNDLHPLIKENNSKMSFVLFVKCDSNVYLICAGNGYHIVKKFICRFFGIDFFCKIFTKAEVTPNFIKYRGYTGRQLLGQIFYRENHKLVYEDDFGKVYSEIASKIDKEKAKELFEGVELDLKSDLSIEAKDSIQIKKSLSLDDLKKICFSINKIDKEYTEKFSLNRIVRLTKKDRVQEECINKFEKRVDELILESIKGNCYNFELMSPDSPEVFLNADYYNVYEKGKRKSTKEYKAGEIFSFKTLVDDFCGFESSVTALAEKDSEEQLLEDFLNLRIRFGIGDDFEDSYKVKDLIVGDVKIGNQTCFRIDGFWYEYKNDFIKYINEESCSLIKEHLNKALLRKKWPLELSKEEQYIELYFGSDWLPLHTIKIENIEICDLLKIDNVNKIVYLVHIKSGFDSILRDLVSQAMISTRMIMEDRSQGSKNISSYLKAIKNKRSNALIATPTSYNDKLANSCRDIPFEELKTALKSYKVITCIAIRDDAIIERDFGESIEAFDSNIAKISIVDYVKRFSSYNLECLIIQLKRS